MSRDAVAVDRSGGARLRLVRGGRGLVEDPREVESHPRAEGALLIACSDALRRARLRTELCDSIPPAGALAEAGSFAELLERAPTSCLVVLGGSLDQIPVRMLTRILGHRHPWLPVVSLEGLEVLTR